MSVPSLASDFLKVLYPPKKILYTGRKKRGITETKREKEKDERKGQEIEQTDKGKGR